MNIDGATYLVSGLTDNVSFRNVLGLTEKIAEQISIQSVTEVLLVVAGACVGLVFLWWGVRKVIGAIMSAFRKGKLKI